MPLSRQAQVINLLETDQSCKRFDWTTFSFAKFGYQQDEPHYSHEMEICKAIQLSRRPGRKPKQLANPQGNLAGGQRSLGFCKRRITFEVSIVTEITNF